MTHRRSVPPGLRDAYDIAIAHGWTIEVLGSGHLRWSPPKGPYIVAARSPSDYRGIRNAIARLRRAGLPIPH